MSQIVMLTGAGISAESGLSTFRASDGLWENHKVEDVCTPEGMARNPELVYNFYNTLRTNLKNVEPNAGHLALVELARTHTLTLVTQNVDDLHERAMEDNPNVNIPIIHMHGELKKTRCLFCKEVYLWEEDFFPDTPCTKCGQKSLRPHIVFFGEMPFYMDEIYYAVSQCDIFIAIGTSGVVYPAAGLVQEARRVGAHCIEFNLNPSAQHGYFDESHIGPASKTLVEWVSSINSNKK